MISLPTVGGGFSVTVSNVETDINLENYDGLLRTAANSLQAIATDYAALSFLNTDILGTRLSVNQLVSNIINYLDIGAVLDAYLDETAAADRLLLGYVEYLTNNWLSNLPFADGGVNPFSVGITGTGFTLGFDDDAVFDKSTTLSLGTEGEDLGLRLDSTLDFSVAADLDFDVSIDLGDGSVVLDVQTFDVSASASSNIIVEGWLGPLNANIGKSGDEGTAAVTFNGSVLYDGTAFSVDAASDVNIDLPFFVTLGEADLTANSSPRFVVTGDFLVEASDPDYNTKRIQVSTDGFAELADFANLDYSQVPLAIKGVVNWLADLSQSSSFDLEIPYTDLKLSDIVHFPMRTQPISWTS